MAVRRAAVTPAPNADASGASKTKRATIAYQPHQILPPHDARK
jgi:hypothetical protein